MSALTNAIAQERRRVSEAWRSGFALGCFAAFVVLAPIVVLALVLVSKCPN